MKAQPPGTPGTRHQLAVHVAQMRAADDSDMKAGGAGPLKGGADGRRISAPVGHGRPVPVEHDGLEPTIQPVHGRTREGQVAVCHSAATATALLAASQSES